MIQVKRFCDFILSQIKIFPDIDFRFVDKKYSSSFHRNLQIYTAGLILGDNDSDEAIAGLQREIDLWNKISKDYDEVFKSVTPDKYRKLKKVLTTYRVYHKVNIVPEDVVEFEEIKKATPGGIRFVSSVSDEETDDLPSDKQTKLIDENQIDIVKEDSDKKTAELEHQIVEPVDEDAEAEEALRQAEVV